MTSGNVTWIHWFLSFLLADQAPVFPPPLGLLSLALVGPWLESHLIQKISRFVRIDSINWTNFFLTDMNIALFWDHRLMDKLDMFKTKSTSTMSKFKKMKHETWENKARVNQNKMIRDKKRIHVNTTTDWNSRWGIWRRLTSEEDAMAELGIR